MPWLYCTLQSDLALLTVTEDAFWTDLRPLEFIKETPELQVLATAAARAAAAVAAAARAAAPAVREASVKAHVACTMGSHGVRASGPSAAYRVSVIVLLCCTCRAPLLLLATPLVETACQSQRALSAE